MKGSLYKITNNLNNKCYIGKTYKKIVTRFKEHVYDAKRYPHRKLYKAFNKYGIDNFSIELLDKFEQDLLEDKEQEFILQYDSFKNGYNSTLGGEGKRYVTVPDEDIITSYKALGTIEAVHRSLKLDYTTIRNVLSSNGVTIVAKPKIGEKAIKIIEVDCDFTSLIECAKFLQDTDLTSASNSRGIASHVREVALGTRKSYLGFTYKFIP